MRKRKGFTLFEMLIVIGIIVVLASIILVTVNRARRSAEIASEGLDFQAIEAALESYHHDFGSYPKDIALPSWNTNAGQTPPTQPPGCLTLAQALMGPGPGAPQALGTTNIFTAGDGADGPGFRVQTMNIPATASGSSVTFNTPLLPAQVPTFVQGQSVWWFDQEQNVSGIFVHTLAAIVSVTSPTSVTTSGINGLTWSPGAPTANGTTGVLRIAIGKTWGPYLPPERFQLAYLDPTRVGDAADNVGNMHYPVLLDRWGGEIQYFPAYGPATNRTAQSSYPQYATQYGFISWPPNPLGPPITAGPLFGYAAPEVVDTSPVKSIAFPYGSYAIYDQRDGAPVIDTLSSAGPEAIPWHLYTYVHPRPTTTGQTTTDLSLAVKWMLGDNNLNNLIDNGESYQNIQPYILISAGPDGPTRSDGGFCDFSQIPSTSGSPTYQNAFKASGNIYNFNRQ